MDRKVIIYSALLVLVLGLLIFIDSQKVPPVNWSPTYSVNDKIPFGLYVLEKESETLLKGQKIEKIVQSPYEFFDEAYNYKDQVYNAKGTFLKIEEKNSFDQESVNELINFARHGNTVFLSMKQFPPSLLDTLEINTNTTFRLTDSLAMQVNRPQSKKHYFAEGATFAYFDSLDTATGRILGYQFKDTLRQPNFIKVPIGAGSFILHTQPAVFSNFHLLKSDHFKYAEDVLGVLPDGNIYWHTGGIMDGKSSSPLRYIVSQPALKWGLYLALISLMIFLFFNAKRKQRIIPQRDPVRNTTVDFAKTIGNLYLQEGNHHVIIEKKIIFFLEKVRREYMIDTYALDDAFVEKFHLKSGIAKEDIQHAADIINKHRHQFESTEKELIEVNKAIEKLKI